MTSMEWAARFAEMGARITERWRARRRDEAAFPEIAQRVLEETDLGSDVDELVLAMLAQDPLPWQSDPEASFGQPPFTTFRGEDFFIEALFWIDGLITIHQHSFSGAFSVFCGSSVHCRYRFTETSRVSSAMALGALELTDTELLVRGDVRPIHAGPALIHSTFHLERPTVTIIVRTDTGRESGPQYNYLPPSLALDPFQPRPAVTKRIQLLTMLHAARPDAYWRAAELTLARADFHAAYLILAEAWRTLERAEDRARLFAIARATQGADLDLVLPVLEESAKKRAFVARRDGVTDDELRFVLALLLNVPKRAAIFDLLGERFPGVAPTEVLLRNLQKLNFDEVGLSLAKFLMTGDSSRDALKEHLARENVRFTNDYELLACVRMFREAPGFGALFA
ncbi:MAG: hypothetical protein KIT84_05735 [Labilithrix sp.]|nr:hypothetical protein [Labilithrix sp.]MCW5810490.1 hypothetical protein [Labilithrix sp.]